MTSEAAKKLASLDIKTRENLDPFPLISPRTGEAKEVKYYVEGIGYIVAKPYDKIYHEKSTILMDISKTFSQKAGARGTLLIGPKASGKTHLLGIEMDYAKKYGAKIILINDKEYNFVEMADIRIPVKEAREEGIIRSICKHIGAEKHDIDGLIEKLKNIGWDAVQIIIDDLYEKDWGKSEIINDVFTLFKLHTLSYLPVIRTSVALHTSSKISAGDFFDNYLDEVVELTISYEDGHEFAKRIVDAMLNGEIIPGAAVIPIVTEWHRYVDEEYIEEAFRDFFSKYVMTVEDPELRELKLEDLADESYIMETVIRTIRFGVYRVFAESSSRLWRFYKGEKIRASQIYMEAIDKFKELLKESMNQSKHLFYKKLLNDTISKIMRLKGATLSRTRKWIISGGRVRWRLIEYYVVNGTEIVVIIPGLALRKSGKVVVERPNQIAEKIRDIQTIMPTAQIVAVVTEDVDDRGLRDVLGTDRYALLKFPQPTRSKLKYFYGYILSDSVSSTEINVILKRYVKVAPRWNSAARAFMSSPAR